jgi:hypothetical protein
MGEQILHKGLGEPILEQGLQNTNFFNGRILAAGDLKNEQDADNQHHWQLGQAIGSGVVRGLEVSLVSDGSLDGIPVVSVSGGLALNCAGQAIALPFDVEVALEETGQIASVEAGLFQECLPTKKSVSRTTAGVYILVASPASGLSEEKAPMCTSIDSGKVTGCRSRYAIEGIQFRLEELDLSSLTKVSQTTRNALADLTTKADPASLSKLRNWLAHICFGTEELAGVWGDPFKLSDGESAYLTYGALDALHPETLTDCDVPLALLFWPVGGVKFVDMWSARRRIVQPASSLFPVHIGQRRLAEAEAAFLQFQDQILAMLGEANPAAITVVSRLRYLPAAGYLPVNPGEFDGKVFLQGLEIEESEVDPAFLRLLIHQSWFMEPIDLNAAPLIHVYSAPQYAGYLVFTRQEKEAAPPAQPSEPSGPAPATTGTIQAEVGFKLRDGSSSGGTGQQQHSVDEKGVVLPRDKAKEQDWTLTGSDQLEFSKGAIKVVARDNANREYLLHYVRARGVKYMADKGVVFVRGIAIFRSDELKPGDYRVKAEAGGFKDASGSVQVTAGKAASLSLTLVEEKPGGSIPPDKPKKPGPGTWIKPGWYEKIDPLEKYIRWPWPPPEERPGFDAVVDPPPEEVNDWKESWGEWVQAEYPGAPVDTGNIQIYIDQAYTPEAMAENAYAYMVFGENGAYVPLVLTPFSGALEVKVPVTKTGMKGIDADLEGQMASFGLDSVDKLAASWKGLVADAVGISTDAAGSMIAEAGRQVASLQGTLLIFTGVDAALADTLARLKIDSPAALANADPKTLAGQAGIPLNFAQRLVEQARQAVPASEWSLGASQLGLKGEEIASLQSKGIATQGQLKSRAETSASEIAAILNTTVNQVAEIAGSVTIKGIKDFQKDRQAASSVTGVVGVSKETGMALVGMGFATTGALANATPDQVAAAFAGNKDLAAEAINAAKGKMI